jgi:hypothetical protein
MAKNDMITATIGGAVLDDGRHMRFRATGEDLGNGEMRAWAPRGWTMQAMLERLKAGGRQSLREGDIVATFE